MSTLSLPRAVFLLAVGLFIGFGLSINEKAMVAHQAEAELGRLASYGFLVRMEESEERCLRSQPISNELVVFCFSDTEVGLVRSELWSAKVHPSDEQALIELWINGYLRQGQSERAVYGAARLATLVVRDKLGAKINEPLAPMLLPQAKVMRSQSPSHSGIWGVILAAFVYLLCEIVGRLSALNR